MPTASSVSRERHRPWTTASQACADDLCDGVPATPVFAWDPVPGATSYRVYVALDVNFTFKAMGSTVVRRPRTRAAALVYGSPTTCPR